MTQAIPATDHARLADATRLGAVELRVTELDRSIDFYTRVIGLRLQRRDGEAAWLHSGGAPIVVLRADPQARRPAHEAGLYHFALLLGSRAELAHAARRIAEARAPIDGASDHGTHEAIYLPDPDGIGIELAADRPREQWPMLDGTAFLANGPQALDLGSLLGSIDGEPTAPQADARMTVGHIHLHTVELEASTRFYRDGLGFHVTTTMPTAMFVAAGGYHHHVAYNLWRGPGLAPAGEDALGLIRWTLETTGAGERDAIRGRLERLGTQVLERDDGLLARDPSGIAVLIV